MSKKKSAFKCLALVAALAALQGCGGGGNGGFFPMQTDANAKDPGTQVDEPTPDAVSGTDPNTVDPTACITEPQPGSTAAVGNELEGVWGREQTGFGIMMTDSALQSVGWTYAGAPEGWFEGTLSYSAPNASWQFDSGAVRTSISQWRPLSGQGNFVAKSTMAGSYTADGTGAPFSFGPWSYDVPTNSLALTPAILQGTWGNTDDYGNPAISVAADGSFTGEMPATNPFGTCTFSGTLAVAEPGSSKNSVRINWVATDSAQAGEPACSLTSTTDGVGAVLVDQTTTDGSCKQFLSLRLFLKNTSGRYTTSLAFLKQ